VQEQRLRQPAVPCACRRAQVRGAEDVRPLGYGRAARAHRYGGDWDAWEVGLERGELQVCGPDGRSPGVKGEGSVGCIHHGLQAHGV
jgi:hypothetical protein